MRIQPRGLVWFQRAQAGEPTTSSAGGRCNAARLVDADQSAHPAGLQEGLRLRRPLGGMEPVELRSAIEGSSRVVPEENGSQQFSVLISGVYIYRVQGHALAVYKRRSWATPWPPHVYTEANCRRLSYTKPVVQFPHGARAVPGSRRCRPYMLARAN